MCPEVLTAKNLIMLGCLTEFFEAASRHVHSFDNAGGSRGSGQPSRSNNSVISQIALASRRAQEVREQMSRLFDFHAADGSQQVPLVLNKDFSRGYVQMICEGMQELSNLSKWALSFDPVFATGLIPLMRWPR